MRTRIAHACLAALLITCAVGCKSVEKQDGIFRVKGTALKLFSFSLPRTDFETVSDAIVREVGADAEITNIWKTGPFRPWYNLLYPFLGVETIEVYGTY